MFSRIFLFLAGLAMPLAFAPFGYWPVAVVSVAVLFWLGAVKSDRPFLSGWLWGFGQFLWGVHWVYVSTHVFAKAPVAMAVVLVILLAAYLALFPALTLWLTKRFGRDHKLSQAMLFVALWSLLELARGYFLSGFPWLALGYSHLESPLAGFAPVFGIYGLGLLSALLSMALVYLLTASALRKKITAIAVAAALLVGAQGLSAVEWTNKQSDSVKALLVQGNISQDKKWRRDWLEKTMQRYYNLTVDNWADADLILWPEVAIPGAYHHFQDSYFEPIARRAAQENKTVITGIMRLVDEQYSNSIVQLKAPPEAPIFYDKQHLVPFGEFFPVPDFIRVWLKAIELPFTDLYVGDGSQRLEINGRALGASICFEDAFGEELIRALPESELLINVTNDGWFGESIAPHQHMQMARMRALETGRWMLRAANTGISAAINHKGRLAKSIPQFETEVLLVEVPFYRGATPFVLVGNIGVLGLVLFLLAAAVFFSKALQRRKAADV